MDNDQLLDKIQEHLEGSESRIATQLENLRRDLSADMQRLAARIDIATGLLEKMVPALLSFMQDAGKTEAEFRLRIAALETRVQRMERPQ